MVNLEKTAIMLNAQARNAIPEPHIILVDGDGFAKHFRRHLTRDWMRAGQYSGVFQDILGFVNAFRSTGFELRVFFKGPVVENFKDSKWKEQFTESRRKLASIHKHFTPNGILIKPVPPGLMLPPFEPDLVVKDAFLAAGVPIVCCQLGTLREIAHEHRQAGLLDEADSQKVIITNFLSKLHFMHCFTSTTQKM